MKLKNDPAYAVPDEVDKRNLETIRKLCERKETPERIRPYLRKIAGLWEQKPYLTLGYLISESVDTMMELRYMDEDELLKRLQGFHD